MSTGFLYGSLSAQPRTGMHLPLWLLSKFIVLREERFYALFLVLFLFVLFWKLGYIRVLFDLVQLYWTKFSSLIRHVLVAIKTPLFYNEYCQFFHFFCNALTGVNITKSPFSPALSLFLTLRNLQHVYKIHHKLTITKGSKTKRKGALICRHLS